MIVRAALVAFVALHCRYAPDTSLGAGVALALVHVVKQQPKSYRCAPLAAFPSTLSQRHHRYSGAPIGTTSTAHVTKGNDDMSNTRTAADTASQSPPAAPVYGLYEIQEQMLVQRGIHEEALMSSLSGNSSPLLAKKLKKGSGNGAAKGFGSGTSGKATSKSRWVNEARQYAKDLQTEGVVRIDNVLSPSAADRLREFVLDLRRDSVDQVQNGNLVHSERFADVLLRSNRCDLKMPLGCPNDKTSSGSSTTSSSSTPVMEALHHVLCESAVKDCISTVKGLSDQAVLYELSCLISDPGSQRQVVHPDNPYIAGRDEPTLLTCFIALQDVYLNMGPTIFLPRTHTVESHATFADESVPSTTEGVAVESPKDTLLRTTPSVVSTLTKGSCAIFDSRLLHCGSANRSHDSRAIFYFSFRNPAVSYPGNPASIRSDLGAAQITLQQLTDVVVNVCKNGAPNPFAY